MGLLKSLGAGAGEIVGRAVGGTVAFVGEATGSQFIKDVGAGVESSTRFSGRVIGDLAEGVAEVVTGAMTDDHARVDRGARQVGTAAGQTARGVGSTAVALVENTGDVVGGLVTGDSPRAFAGARGVARTVAVGAIAISVIDVAGGVGDLGDVDGDSPPSDVPVASGDSDVDVGPDTDHVHFVNPHEVSGYTTADGTEVASYWRDGDGDTATNLSADEGGGYLRGHPDGDPTNNLRYTRT